MKPEDLPENFDYFTLITLIVRIPKPDVIAKVKVLNRWDRMRLAPVLGILTDKEQLTIIRICCGARQIDVARELKVSPTRIQHHIAKATKKMQRKSRWLIKSF